MVPVKRANIKPLPTSAVVRSEERTGRAEAKPAILYDQKRNQHQISVIIAASEVRLARDCVTTDLVMKILKITVS